MELESLQKLVRAFENDADMAIAVAMAMIESCPEQIENVRMSMTDPNALKSAIHALKGSLSAFGDLGPYAEIKQIDESLRDRQNVLPAEIAEALIKVQSFVAFLQKCVSQGNLPQ